jgi:hypothetical protein
MENIIFVGENVHGSHEFSENRFNIIRTYAQYDPIIILETDHIGFTYAYENGLSIDVCMRFLPNIYKTLEYYNLILYWQK